MRGIYKSEAGKQAVEAFYRNALQQWPVENDQRLIPTRFGETFVVSCGPATAPPVLLLHGSGSNSVVWIREVMDWAKRYRVYAVDIIGEPGLSAPARPPLRSSAYAEWLDDVHDQLGLTAASLVGVSLGGWMALDYAVRRPARVASISLLSPSGIGRRKKLFMLKAGVMLLFGKRGIEKALAAAVGKVPLATPMAQYVQLIFQNFRPRREAPPLRSDEELRALSVPIQVIVGMNDAMLDAGHTRDRVRRLVPRAELTCLEGTGHMLPPQTSRVGEFLAMVWSAHEPKQFVEVWSESSRSLQSR